MYVSGLIDTVDLHFERASKLAAISAAASIPYQSTRKNIEGASADPHQVEAYATDPASQANTVKSLTGREGIRLRVGDWRVIMDDQGNVLAVLEIDPRSGIYD
ncbi:MAG: type II toxin-antitoxin system RelE family toxin [Paracoccaceae bacterium]